MQGIRLERLRDAFVHLGIDLALGVSDAAKKLKESANGLAPLARIDPSWVADAQVTVVYLWNTTVGEIVDTVSNAYDPQTVVWLDVLCFDQDATRDPSFEWWRDMMRSKMTLLQRACIVMAPRYAPAVLERTWCIYDILVAVQCNVVIDFAVTASEKAAFMAELVNDPIAIISHTIAHAQRPPNTCSDAAAHGAIMRAIAEFGGWGKLSMVMVTRLREWFRVTLETEARMRPDDGHVQRALGDVYAHQGNPDAAIRTFDAHPMENDVRWLLSSGMEHLHQGHVEEADRRITAAMSLANQCYGASDERMLRVLCHVGILRHQQAHFADAVSLLETCISLCPAPDHPFALNAHMNLGVTYMRQGDLPAAKRELLAAVQGYQRRREHLHELLSCLYFLTSCMHQAKEFAQAEPWLKKCLYGRTLLLGTNHLSTLNTLSALAYGYAAQDKFTESIEYYRWCWAVSSHTRGERDEMTLKFLFNCALENDRAEHSAAAEDLYLQCYQHRKAVLGEHHLDTIAAAVGYAEMLVAQKRNTTLARALLELALEIYTKAGRECDEARTDVQYTLTHFDALLC